MNKPLSDAAVVTANNTPFRVWITIYDLSKTMHLDYGWLEPARAADDPQEASHAGNRTWRGGFRYGDIYHVRGEVMDATGQVIADAITQVNPKTGAADPDAARQHDPALVLMAKDGRFWWQTAEGRYG